MKAIPVDSKTIIVKAKKVSDITDVRDFISKKRLRKKKEAIDALLKFASEHQFYEKGYVFNRDECYDE